MRYEAIHTDVRTHVKLHHMSWSGQGGFERRGYHHGNLREALIAAALDLIAQKGPAATPPTHPGSSSRRPTTCAATWP